MKRTQRSGGSLSLRRFALQILEISPEGAGKDSDFWVGVRHHSRDVYLYVLFGNKRVGWRGYRTRLGTRKRSTLPKLTARGYRISMLLECPLAALRLASGGRP